MKIFLVVENRSRQELQPNADYRRITLVGCTYNEVQFREWVNEVWHVDKNINLGILAAHAAKGGWVVYTVEEV